MSEENKYSSFFPAEDSPIPIPPAEEAWSLMQRQLNVQLPVRGSGSGVGGGAGWSGRLFRLRHFRWGISAATVAIVTVGVWVGLYKGRQDHSGRPAAQVVSRGSAAKPMDSVGSGDAARSGDAVDSGDAARSGDAVDSEGMAVAPAAARDRSRKMENGKSSGSVTKGEGSGGPRTAMVKVADGSGKGGRSRKDGKIGKGQHGAGNGEDNSQTGPAGHQMDVAESRRDLAGHQRQRTGTVSVATARIGSNRAGSFPDNLAIELASGRSVAKGPLARKKGTLDKGRLMLAAGLGDGQNFPLGGQQTIAINSAGGSGKLTDHLPSAYARLYIGDRIYLQAGLRLYSPQYMRPQQIDSTGDSSRLAGYQGYIQDTIVTVNKLYYTDIPLAVYYRVAGQFYLGAGVQYSRLWGGNTTQRVALHPTNGVDTNLIVNSNLAIDLKNEPRASAHLNKSDWRMLLDAAWSWKRLTLGLRYQQALSSYTRGAGEGGSKARNTALSLYASYDIWRRRLKK